jgi:hypothetical protein
LVPLGGVVVEAEGPGDDPCRLIGQETGHGSVQGGHSTGAALVGTLCSGSDLDLTDH